jgi:hypothetical protein
VCEKRVRLNAQSAYLAELILTEECPEVEWHWSTDFIIILSGPTRNVESARRRLMFG